MNEIYCRACGCKLARRCGKFGEFWGCTGYPRCKQTMTLREAELEWDEEESKLDEGNFDETDCFHPGYPGDYGYG